MLVKLMLDIKKFDKKPTGYETGGVQKRISQTEIEIEDLAIGLCNGMTCKPALLNGTKSVDWIQQQVFMLDFDHDTTIEKELQNCNTYGIMPVFGYTSFSHSEEEHHFRLVFVADEVITDVDKRNKLQITLINTFDKSDKVTFDCTRIFYGGNGKEPIAPNYNVRINADDIIEKYYKDEYELPVKKVKGKSNKVKSDKVKSKINNVIINNSYMDNINAIKELNADKLRSLICELEMTTNKEDINNLLLSVYTSSYTFKSEKDLYNYINSIDLGKYLGIGNETVSCILPEHEDNTPSAHIYITDDGTPIYKCFGCDNARTITTITEELANCTRSEAIEFIKKVYNIELVQSDWTLKQKQLLIDSANYLDTTDFVETFPELNKIIRTRKLHIQKLLMHFTQYVNEDLQVEGKPLFFASYNTLMKICEINPNNRTRFSQSLTLFTLLNMLDKVQLNCIPEEELNKAKHISAKYGFKKLTNFYQFGEYGFNQFKESEGIAKILKQNNFSLKGLSREYVLRTFGNELADKVFPQYKFENKRGTSNNSDNFTLTISEHILETIKKKGYILEKDVKINNKIETQWKKSIQEILDTYGLIKIKASKQNKELYGLPADISYQSFVICQNYE
ncbi:hypothetical protein [Konateibacter massiliensis]|uniref:hypothetical protein n=1 Tax=Konateibacter massiliensis TaxID=2002841 RepID=UPI000C15F24D|nr:hypothetical protein [Konateibacter massiliensis]